MLKRCFLVLTLAVCSTLGHSITDSFVIEIIPVEGERERLYNISFKELNSEVFKIEPTDTFQDGSQRFTVRMKGTPDSFNMEVMPGEDDKEDQVTQLNFWNINPEVFGIAATELDGGVNPEVFVQVTYTPKEEGYAPADETSTEEANNVLYSPDDDLSTSSTTESTSDEPLPLEETTNPAVIEPSTQIPHLWWIPTTKNDGIDKDKTPLIDWWLDQDTVEIIPIVEYLGTSDPLMPKHEFNGLDKEIPPSTEAWPAEVPSTTHPSTEFLETPRHVSCQQGIPTRVDAETVDAIVDNARARHIKLVKECYKIASYLLSHGKFQWAYLKDALKVVLNRSRNPVERSKMRHLLNLFRKSGSSHRHRNFEEMIAHGHKMYGEDSINNGILRDPKHHLDHVLGNIFNLDVGAVDVYYVLKTAWALLDAVLEDVN